MLDHGLQVRKDIAGLARTARKRGPHGQVSKLALFHEVFMLPTCQMKVFSAAPLLSSGSVFS